MLKNFDVFCENLLLEGRKPDDKKKFKVNIDKVKQHINEIGEKHHHYRNDKSHFLTIVDELNPNTLYTPKSFMEHVKSIMKGFGKPFIADGYGKLLYAFLKDRIDTPFEDHNGEKEEENDKSEEDKEEDSFDELFPQEDQEKKEEKPQQQS
jgi:hypothetical protein